MKSKLLKGFVGLMVLGATSLHAQFDDLYSDPIKRVTVKKEVTTTYSGIEIDDYDADGSSVRYNNGGSSPEYYDDLDYTYSRRINRFRRNSFMLASPMIFNSFYDPFYDPFFFDPFWGSNTLVVNVGIGGGFGWNRWNSGWGWNNPGWNSWNTGWGWNSWGLNRWNTGWGNSWAYCPPSWNRPFIVNNYYNNAGSTVNNNPNNVTGLNRYYGSRTTSSTSASTEGRVEGPRSYRGTTPGDQNLTTRGKAPETTAETSRRGSTEAGSSRPSIFSRGSEPASSASTTESVRSSGRGSGSGTDGRTIKTGETQRSVYGRPSEGYSGSRTSPASRSYSGESSGRSSSGSSDFGRSSGSSRSSSDFGSSRSSGSGSSGNISSRSGSSSGGGGRSSGRGG
jgi:hypothetical protein